MGVKEKTIGEVRYFTYFLTLPPALGSDEWVDQVEFVHDLQFEMKNACLFRENPSLARDVLAKGECQWEDPKGGKHRIKVETVKREKRWGFKEEQPRYNEIARRLLRK